MTSTHLPKRTSVWSDETKTRKIQRFWKLENQRSSEKRFIKWFWKRCCILLSHIQVHISYRESYPQRLWHDNLGPAPGCLSNAHILLSSVGGHSHTPNDQASKLQPLEKLESKLESFESWWRTLKLRTSSSDFTWSSIMVTLTTPELQLDPLHQCSNDLKLQ